MMVFTDDKSQLVNLDRMDDISIVSAPDNNPDATCRVVANRWTPDGTFSYLLRKGTLADCHEYLINLKVGTNGR